MYERFIVGNYFINIIHNFLKWFPSINHICIILYICMYVNHMCTLIMYVLKYKNYSMQGTYIYTYICIYEIYTYTYKHIHIYILEFEMYHGQPWYVSNVPKAKMPLITYVAFYPQSLT